MSNRRLEIILSARNEAKAALKGVMGDLNNLKAQLKSMPGGGAVSSFFSGNWITSGLRSGIDAAKGLLTGFLAQIFAFSAAAAAALTIKFSISAAADAEVMRARLIALTKSATQTGEIIEWVRKKAKETPFEVPGLMEMVSQLMSVGVNFKDWFQDLGDLAVQGGRDLAEGLEMATLAIVRLKTGSTGEAFEQLRRLKISRQDLEGQGVKFNKGGELISSVDEALAGLQRVIRTKYGGSMLEMQDTATVAFSNIADGFRDVVLMFAGVGPGFKIIKGGFFDTIKKSVQDVLKWFETNKTTISAWSKNAGDAIAGWIKTLWGMKDQIAKWGKAIWDAFLLAAGGAKDVLYAILGLDKETASFSDVMDKIVVIIRLMAIHLKIWANTWVNVIHIIRNAIGKLIDFLKKIPIIKDIPGLDDFKNLFDLLDRQPKLKNFKTEFKEAEEAVSSFLDTANKSGKEVVKFTDSLVDGINEVYKGCSRLIMLGGALQDWQNQLLEAGLAFNKIAGSDAGLHRLTELMIKAKTFQLEWNRLTQSSVNLTTDDRRAKVTEEVNLMTQLANLKKDLLDLDRSALNSQVDLAKANLEAVRETTNSRGAEKNAIYGVIEAEMAYVDWLQKQRDLSRDAKRFIDANSFQAEIFKVEAEISRMRKELKKGFETDFEKMAAKIINAPQNLQRLLGRAGVAMFERQAEAMLKISSGGRTLDPYNKMMVPPQVTVNIKAYLDGKAIDAKVESTVDRRVGQLAPVGGT